MVKYKVGFKKKKKSIFWEHYFQLRISYPDKDPEAQGYDPVGWLLEDWEKRWPTQSPVKIVEFLCGMGGK